MQILQAHNENAAQMKGFTVQMTGNKHMQCRKQGFREGALNI